VAAPKAAAQTSCGTAYSPLDNNTGDALVSLNWIQLKSRHVLQRPHIKDITSWVKRHEKLTMNQSSIKRTRTWISKQDVSIKKITPILSNKFWIVKKLVGIFIVCVWKLASLIFLNFHQTNETQTIVICTFKNLLGEKQIFIKIHSILNWQQYFGRL
jgi:hypothetical protein